jgi:hypothetical protein
MLNSIKAPYFHWRVDYDRLIKDESQSRASFEYDDLLLDTFCLSTIFAGETAGSLDVTVNRLFKKKDLCQMCQKVDLQVRVSFRVDKT